MSHYDYIKGREIQMQDYPFYAIIQAAMRQADTDNLVKLRAEFPDVWEELEARYRASDGWLEGEERT